MDFVMIGNDIRLRCAAISAKQEGFEAEYSKSIDQIDLRRASCVVLSPRAKETAVHETSVKNIVERMTEGSILISGMWDQEVSDLCKIKTIQYETLDKDEHFARENAVLTAKAALSRYNSLYQKDLKDKKVYVLGSGRVAQALVQCLNKEKIKPTVIARSSDKLKTLKNQSLADIVLLSDKQPFLPNSIVFNTIPYPILKTEDFPDPCVYMELASKPYGVRFEDVPGHIKYSIEGGLPVKIMPIVACDAFWNAVKRRSGI